MSHDKPRFSRIGAFSFVLTLSMIKFPLSKVNFGEGFGVRDKWGGAERAESTTGCYNKSMITKHFFKILVVFIIIIVFGLIGVFLASHFG